MILNMNKRTKKSHSDKKEKHYKHLCQSIESFVENRNYEPVGQAALFKAMKLHPSHLDLAKKAITDLLKAEKIRVEKKRIFPMKKAVLITGMLNGHPRGFGFVVPDREFPDLPDIFIPKDRMHSAVDGDHVELEVFKSSKEGKGPEGTICEILERNKKQIAGIVQDFTKARDLVLYLPLYGPTKKAQASGKKGVEYDYGDRVLIEITDWDDQGIKGNVIKSLGNISDASKDASATAEEYGIRTQFPTAVLNSVKKFGTEITKDDFKNRVDLTKQTCYTIDPDTAKDFDDALALKRDKQGNYHLAVHIADVSHYVTPNSELDKEAFLRANSTYFPETCLPMLPEALSNELCSLKPNVIRLTVTVFMTFDKNGDLLEQRIERSAIKSAKRFTYRDVKSILDGKKKSKYKESLEEMVELCLLLKKKRAERGSVDFSLSEIAIKVDENGVPTGLEIIEYDITHQLVEEFMLKANETVAKVLSASGNDLIFRIHEEPAEENITEFFQHARSLGFKLPPNPSTRDLQQLFEQAKESPLSRQLAYRFIRTMKMAFYSRENVGHYGLRLTHYCHFTSPIRRYSDLVIHRLLVDKKDQYDVEKAARQCSERERISMRAENRIKLLKKLRLLQNHYEKNQDQLYSAVITGVKPFGVSFELEEWGIDGFIHVSQLKNDYYVYVPAIQALSGTHTGKGYHLGMTFELIIQHIDLVLCEVEWTVK